MAYVDFNDDNIPLGERKKAFVRWLTQSRGLSLGEAKQAALRKFDSQQIRAAWAEEKWAQLQNRHYFRRGGRG